MAFVKLDCGMLDSSIWIERNQREIFITALLMGIPREIGQPTPQLHVDRLEETGWMVPAGWYGIVEAAGVGILARAGFTETDMEQGIEALRAMGEPDLNSRSQTFEGRRLVRVNHGYVILNFQKYRDKDYSAAQRQRAYRARQKAKAEAEEAK